MARKKMGKLNFIRDYLYLLVQSVYLRPDYSHKLFSDTRGRYIFLMVALAADATA